MKNFITKELKELSNSIKGLKNPQILFLGFTVFACALCEMNKNNSTAECEEVEDVTEELIAE